MHQQTGAPKVPLGFVFEGRPSSLRAFVKKLGPGGSVARRASPAERGDRDNCVNRISLPRSGSEGSNLSARLGEDDGIIQISALSTKDGRIGAYRGGNG